MSDDRFDDLGRQGEEASAAERRESIGDQLAERDRTHPEPSERPPEVPRPGNKYAWVVGIVALMLVAIAIFVRTIPNAGESLFGPTPGKRAPAFALPLALGSVEGDANLCQRRPCPEGTGKIPACAVELADVMNVCQLWKGPLVLTFIVDRGADCFPQVDRTERVRPRVPGVTFATVYFSQKDRDEVRQVVRGRRWKQPVGFETGDGDVTARYGVGVCPTTIFMRKGGIVAESTFGNLTEAQLLRKARRLQRET